MKQYSIYSLGLIGLYIIGLVLYYLHFPYFLYLIGLPLFFLPGINIALALEQVVGEKFGRIKLVLIAYITAITCNSLVVYLYSSHQGVLGDQKNTFTALGIWYLISLLLLIIIRQWKKSAITPFFTKNAFNQNRYFFYSLGIFTIFMGIILILYPYLSEGDGYTYIKRVSNLYETHRLSVSEDRPLFMALIWSLNQLTQIPVYWIFKILMPMGLFTFVMTLNLLNRPFVLKDDKRSLLYNLLFLGIPVIVIEGVISRPQLVLMSLMPVVLLLLGDAVLTRDNKAKLYQILLVITLSVIGFKIHQLFLFAFLISLIALLLFIVPLVKRYPPESILVFLLSVYTTLISLKYFGLYNYLVGLAIPFVHYIIHPNFNLWFLSGYKDMVGGYVSWPGISFVFYYGYVIGLLLPLSIAMYLFLKARGKLNTERAFSYNHYQLYIYAAVLFFFVAEIVPRLGLAFQPDRAWIFCSICISLFMPALIHDSIKALKGRFFVVYSTVFIASLLVAAGFVTLKQGWTTRNEYQAAQFLKDNTPKNSKIISQQANHPLINVFAERTMLVPKDDFFYSPSSTLDYLVYDADDHRSELVDKKATIEREVNQLLYSPREQNIFASSGLWGQVLNQLEEYQATDLTLAKYGPEIKEDSAPIYVLYSMDKFKGYYNRYADWKRINYFGANLSKFNNQTAYQKVYEHNGVQIWKVK